VAEPQITAWRRAVTGDLTSVFDFAAPGRAAGAALPDASALPAMALTQASLPSPRPPATPAPPPRQEPGARPARALPYAFDAAARRTPDGLVLSLANTGAAGGAFALYPAAVAAGGPWFYAVEAGKTLEDRLPIGPVGYDFTLHGPNGFLRQFRGGPADAIEVASRYDAGGMLRLTLRNVGSGPVRLKTENAYARGDARRLKLASGGEVEDACRSPPPVTGTTSPSPTTQVSCAASPATSRPAGRAAATRRWIGPKL
jgi:phospholipase C